MDSRVRVEFYLLLKDMPFEERLKLITESINSCENNTDLLYKLEVFYNVIDYLHKQKLTT
jgi:hypothetical protein